MIPSQQNHCKVAWLHAQCTSAQPVSLQTSAIYTKIPKLTRQWWRLEVRVGR